MQLLHRARGVPGLAATVVMALVLSSGCTVGDAEGDEAKTGIDLAAVEVDEKAKALVPPEVADAGTLKVATELNWPPFTYKSDAGKPTGVDILLIQAIGRKLGLETNITDVGVTAVIPSVQNGRFDVAVGQLVNSPDRRAVVDFVDYLENSLGLIVRKDSADSIDPVDLCGHTLVATQGTGPLSFGRTYSKEQCVAKGKPEITFEVFADSAGTLLALGNGRGDGFMSNAAVGTYLAETSGQNLVMDEGTVPGHTDRSGIVYRKGRTQMGDAVRAALLSLQADGVYTKILEQWKIGDQALTEAQINETRS